MYLQTLHSNVEDNVVKPIVIRDYDSFLPLEVTDALTGMASTRVTIKSIVSKHKLCAILAPRVFANNCAFNSFLCIGYLCTRHLFPVTVHMRNSVYPLTPRWPFRSYHKSHEAAVAFCRCLRRICACNMA